MIELLSPAKDKETFISAVQSGADAVYMGIGKMNARAMVDNFTIDDFIFCLDYAKIYNVKVYLALNILLSSDEIKEAIYIIEKLYNAGLDAVIVQDIGLASVIKKLFKDLKLHASTQMTVHNIDEVKFLEGNGFSRVVLARELTTDEIEEIAKNTSLELEVFVHGALCVSFSGQCLMSSMIGQRSGNRGLCAGSCRLKYKIYEENKLKNEGYLLSKKDILGLEQVNRLKDIGVTSLKIEGRGKTKQYITLVTRKYRKVIDTGKYDKTDEKELMQMFSRTTKSYGYLNGVEGKNSISYMTAKNTGIKLGKVIKVSGKLVKVKLEEDISMQDGVEASLRGENAPSSIVTYIKDEKLNIVNKPLAKGTNAWLGDFKNAPKVGDVIYKTSSKELLDRQDEFLSKIRRKENVIVNITIMKGKKLQIEGENITLNLDYIPEKAVTKALSIDDVLKAMSKTEDTFFNISLGKCTIDSNLYVPISKLNELRRAFIAKIIENRKVRRENLKLKLEIEKYFSEKFLKDTKSNDYIKRTMYIYKYDIRKKYDTKNVDVVYVNIIDFSKNINDILNNIHRYIYVYLPSICLKNTIKIIESMLEKIVKNEKVKGILLGNFGQLDICLKLKEKYNLKLGLDYSFNVSNIYSARFYKEKGIDYICILPEIQKEEVLKINDIIPCEVLENLVTTMVTRFCLVSSFIGCRCTLDKSNFLVDINNVKYQIVNDNTDCICKLVRELPERCKITNKNLISRKCDI